MQSAVNPKTGEVLFLVDNQWVKPSQTAVNPKTGENAYLVNNAWQVMPMPKAGGADRTLGEALVTDPITSLLSGVGTMLGSPGQLKQLITGEKPAEEKPKGTIESLAQTLLPFGTDINKMPEKALQKLTPSTATPTPESVISSVASPFSGLQPVGEELKAFGEKQKSAGLRSAEKGREKAIQEAEGFLPEVGAAVGETVKNPALLTSFIFEQLPNFVGTLGGGALTKEAARAFFKEATEKTLGKVGVGGAIATGGAMQAGDIGSETYQTIYDRLVKEGTPPDQAHQTALEKGRMAAAQAGAISVASSFIPGGKALERRFLTEAGKKAGFPGFVPAVGNILGETVQEGTEEGGGKLVSNLQLAQVFPDVDVMKGVGAATGLGALGGGMFGGISNVPSALSRTPQVEPTPPGGAVPPAGGAVPPAPPATTVPLEAQLEETPRAVRLAELERAMSEVDMAFQNPNLAPEEFNRLNAMAGQIRSQIAKVQAGEEVTAPAPTPTAPVVEAPVAPVEIPTAEAPTVTPVTPKVAVDETGEKLTYPMFVDLADKGYQLHSFENPRTYENKGGVKYRTLEKDGVRIALEPKQVLFTNPKYPNRQPQLGMGNENDVAFHFIGVDPELRKQGKARQALQDLVDTADKNNYTLYGEPAQLEKEGMNAKQLTDLYAQYGFKPSDDSGKVIVREPGAKSAQVEEPKQLAEKYYKPLTSYGWSGTETYGDGFPIVSKAKFVADHGEEELKKLQNSGVVDVHPIQKGAQETLLERLGYKEKFGSPEEFLWTTPLTISPDTHNTPEYQQNYEKAFQKPYTDEYQEVNQEDYKAALEDQEKRKPTKEEKVAANKARQAAKKEKLGTVENVENGVPVKTTYEREPNDNITITKETPEGTIVTHIGGGKKATKVKQEFIPKEDKAAANKARQAEKKAAAEKAKQPVDTSAVPDADKIRKKNGYVIYKRKSDMDYWRVQSVENKLANRIGEGDSAHSDLGTAEDKIYNNINEEESKPQAKPAVEKKEVKPAKAEETLRVSSPTESGLADSLSKYLGGSTIRIDGENVYNAKGLIPYYKVRKEGNRYKLYETSEVKPVEPKKTSTAVVPKVDESWAEYKKKPLTEKPSSMEQDVYDQIKRFENGNFGFIKASFTGANAAAKENAANKESRIIYDKAAREFLNRPVTAKAPAKNDPKLDVGDNTFIVPPPIPKNIKPVKTLADQKKAILSIAASKTDPRKQLQGILVEPDKLVVTDGHRLAMFNTDTGVSARELLTKDGNKIDDTYPRYEAIVDKARTATEIGQVNAIALGNYVRGTRNAYKYIAFSKEKDSQFTMQIGDQIVGFNGRYIEDMANMFRQFGYDGFDVSFDDRGGGGGMLVATSPDGKLTQYVMSMRNEGNVFQPFNIETNQPGYVKAEEKAEPTVEPKAEEKAAPKVEKKSKPKEKYTPEQRENAEHHAKDLGGEVVWQDGDLSLIRGYARASGAPAYSVARGKLRSNYTIKDYKGDLVNADEKEKLIKIAEQTEKDAQEKHKSNPFIKFEDGIKLSEDIPADLGGVIKGWKKLLGLKANIYVSTLEDAKANRNNFTGPHRVIGSGTLSVNEAGSMRRMPDDSYYVLFDKSTSKTKMLETIAHEIGHVHEKEVYINAPKEMKDAIQADYQKWLASQTGKTARELVDSLRAKTSAQTTNVAAGAKVKNLSPYWTSFGEWYADQVSKWAVTSEKPLTIVEKFFKRLGNQMRQFYQNLKNKQYLPSESMSRYLDSMATSEDVIAGKDDDVSSMPESMVKKIEAIPEENREEQSLIEDLNLPEVPEHEERGIKDMAVAGYRKMQDLGKEFGSNPGKTATKSLVTASDAITKQRIENVWFAAGLDKRDQARYNGQIRAADGQMAASIAIKNAVHSAHIATQVIIKGGLEFSQKFGQFVAKNSEHSMGNVVKLQYEIKKKLGKKVGLQVINAYFIAKRSRSIQNEFLNASAALQSAQESGDFAAVADAQSDYNSIKTAYGKIPGYFRQLNEDGKPMYETIYDDNGEAVDRVPILNDEAIDRAIGMEKLHPQLKKMMENWTAVNKNMLDMMAFSGRISKKSAEKLKDIKDYVPWYRIMDDQEDIHNGKLISNYPGGPKRFKAGETERDIDNVVESMIHNVVMMTRGATKTYAINRVISEYGQRYEEGPKKGKLMVFPTEGRDAEGTRIASFIGGRRVVTNIPDDLVADSVIGLIAAPFTFPLQDVLSATANGFRRTITFTPWFQVKQLIIDAPTAAWVSGVRNPFKLWAGCFKGFYDALEVTGDDPVVQILKNAGIGGYQSFHRSARKEREIQLGLLERSNYAKFLNAVDHIGDASDLSQRVAVYRRVLAEKKDPALALLQASDIIDFQKHGKGRLAQAMRTTVTFMQAYATQLDALAQASVGGNLKGKPRAEAQKQFLKTGMLLASTTLMYAFMAGADDDYWELDDQTRLRNFYVPGSKKATGHHILIPMTTSAAFFFKAVPELVYSKIVSEGTKNEMDTRRVAKALGEAAMDALLGPNPVPTGVKPIAEIAFNHDFFTGGNVVPKGLEGLDSAEQYNASTSNLGHAVSKLTGGALNPIQADHLMRGMGGSVATLGMYFSNLAFPNTRPEPELKQNPIIGNLVAPEVSRKNEELFYDLREKATGKYKTYQSMLETDKFDEADKFYEKNQGLIDVYEYVSSMDTDLKEINKDIRRLGKSADKDITPKERTKEINELKRLKSELLDNVTEFRKEAGF